ncbi:MAG TPA: phosphopantetheine-binding protein [Pilimelia sp.]|nr:phosphopantetheine-binding protein [Pilimelia sp.]
MLRDLLTDVLDEPPGDDDDLLDLGLDSIRLMTVVERLRAAGHDVTFVALAERPTLGDWADLLGGTP